MAESLGASVQLGRNRRSAGTAVLLGLLACGALLGCAEPASGEGTGEPTQADQPAVSAPPGGGSSEDPAPEEAADSGSPTPESSPPSTRDTVATPPQQIAIPGIDLEESALVDLHIRADGRLAEPEDWDDVGWFAEGSKPGEAGPTVIAGHVDSRAGPAVFFRLMELEPGDEVTLTDQDGEPHVYRVERFADFPKDDFPTREVFGAQLTDQLRLITCTGEFDAAAGRHLDNRVVFASRIG